VEAKALTANEFLDCKGMLCPLPVVEIAMKMRTVPAGQVLAVFCDALGAHSDIPAWCEMTGNEFLGSEPDGKGARYYIKKATA